MRRCWPAEAGGGHKQQDLQHHQAGKTLESLQAVPQREFRLEEIPKDSGGDGDKILVPWPLSKEVFSTFGSLPAPLQGDFGGSVKKIQDKSGGVGERRKWENIV